MPFLSAQNFAEHFAAVDVQTSDNSSPAVEMWRCEKKMEMQMSSHYAICVVMLSV